jgi:ribosome-associated protein
MDRPGHRAGSYRRGMSDIRISRGLSIPGSEVELSFSRSGGPGGQNVNTVATKVELRFDIEASRTLTDQQKARIREQLANRITKDGVLLIQSSEHRTQHDNRRAAVGRFRNLLREAVRPPKRRIPTRRSRAANERRLEQKRRRAEKKRLRDDPDPPSGW